MTTESDLVRRAREAAFLLDDFHDALSGGGKLTGQSVHLATRKRFRTLARNSAKGLHEAIAKALGVKVSELVD